MPPYNLSSRSKSRLIGVHPDLIRVVELAIHLTEQDFTVLEGVRTKERQAQLVQEGRSQTMNSRHLTGHAVDLGAWVRDRVGWDPKDYTHIAVAMKEAARQYDVPIVWGGDWKTFKDYVHFELDRRTYP